MLRTQLTNKLHPNKTLITLLTVYIFYIAAGEDAKYFSIDTTGEVKLTKFVDYDNGTKLLDRVTMTVNDSAGQEDWVTFNIAIIDLNDNSPMCSQSDYVVDVPENTSPGIYFHVK